MLDYYVGLFFRILVFKYLVMLLYIKLLINVYIIGEICILLE